MAKPVLYDVIGDSITVSNYIRNNGSQNLKNALPVAKEDNCRLFGNILIANTNVRNEFFSALLNLVGTIKITSKRYENPTAFMKKGVVEIGASVEEVFTDLIQVYKYDPAIDQNKFWKRHLADVRSAFHVINYQVYYPNTINRALIAKAFRSWSGVDDMIASVVEAMYKSAAYDEFQCMKYMIARRINDGLMTPVEVPVLTKANMEDITIAVKEVSDQFTFMSTDYNPIGVHNYSNKEDQYLITTPKFNANLNVEVLAAAFNMEKAEFAGHRVLIDGFGKIDLERVKACFTDSDGNVCEGYVELSQDELDNLNKIGAMLIDRDFLQWYDVLEEFTEFYNGRTIEWTYFYHLWEILSTSPFANGVVFVPGAATVESVSITPSEATLSVGAEIQLAVNVESNNFAPKVVNWTSDSEHATVDTNGNVKILGTAQSAEQIVITATAEYPASDGSYKSATCTITVA